MHPHRSWGTPQQHLPVLAATGLRVSGVPCCPGLGDHREQARGFRGLMTGRGQSAPTYQRVPRLSQQHGKVSAFLPSPLQGRALPTPARFCHGLEGLIILPDLHKHLHYLAEANPPRGLAARRCLCRGSGLPEPARPVPRCCLGAPSIQEVSGCPGGAGYSRVGQVTPSPEYRLRWNLPGAAAARREPRGAGGPAPGGAASPPRGGQGCGAASKTVKPGGALVADS